MGNIPVDIEGLARVIKPLILRLKRKASTSLGPGSTLVGGGGGRRGESKKKWAWAKNQIGERAER